VDKNEISRSEIAQAYRIPLSTLLTYLYHLDSFKLQALKGVLIQNTWEFVEQTWQYGKRAVRMVLPCSKERYCSG